MFPVRYWVKVVVTVRHNRTARAWNQIAACAFQLRTQWKKSIVIYCRITNTTNTINHSHMWEGLAVGLGMV